MIQLALYIVSTVIVIYAVIYGGLLLFAGICWLFTLGSDNEQGNVYWLRSPQFVADVVRAPIHQARAESDYISSRAASQGLFAGGQIFVDW